MTVQTAPPGLSGPYLDSLVKELVQWWLDTKEFLIEALTEGGYPFGSEPLTSEQQLENFLRMDQTALEAMSARLALRHQGHPDADARVQKDLADFFTYMEGLHGRLTRG